MFLKILYGLFRRCLPPCTVLRNKDKHNKENEKYGVKESNNGAGKY